MDLVGMDLAGLIGKAKSRTIEPVYKKLGANVARLRENKGLSQAALAAEIGMGSSTIAEIETGSTRILVSDVEKVAKALGVEPKILMQGVWW